MRRRRPGCPAPERGRRRARPHNEASCGRAIAALAGVLTASCHGARGPKTRRGTGAGSAWHLSYPLLPYSGNVSQSWLDVQREAGQLFDRVLYMNVTVEVTGHIWMYPRQAQYYHQVISDLPNGTQMCEAGFGSGLSTLGYLRANRGIRLITFDLWDDTQGRFGFDPVLHQRKVVAEAELLRHFSDRWTLVKGNSFVTIPQFFERNPHVRCDVVHVDGNHTRGGVLTDLAFFQPQVAPSHLVLMDDLQYREIQGALADFSVAVENATCFRTDRRDLRFTGRLTSKKNRKNWCHFTFRRDWAPDEEFINRFLLVTGRHLPPSVLRMARAAAARARAEPRTVNRHAARAEAHAAAPLAAEHDRGLGDAMPQVSGAGGSRAAHGTPAPAAHAAAAVANPESAAPDTVNFPVAVTGATLVFVTAAAAAARRTFRSRALPATGDPAAAH
eukprot:TRINITY_DN56556_c0_g1_i1.p1 TRINITY_DN56556_c0_g1~~TRINITY_DN56556_c0_g1_i1.p1  ORF type:complete len:465 (+),score=72.23 TRINITY_DN56556_c0_g1_i1:66-1397(+)